MYNGQKHNWFLWSLGKNLAFVFNCLPKGRHSDGPREFQGCSSQKCSRGRVGHAGVGWVMVWGRSCTGEVGSVMQGWGGVGHGGVRWGGVGHAGVGWVMVGCGGSCMGEVGWVMVG